MVAAISGITPQNYVPLPIKTAPTFQDWHRYVPSNDPILQQLSKENTCWERFKALFQKNAALTKQIISISKQPKIEQANISKISMAFESPEYHRMRPHLRIILTKLNTDQRTEVFNNLIQKSIDSGKQIALYNCLALITMDELLQGLNVTADNMKLAIQCMAKCESIFLEKAAATEKMKHSSVFSYIAHLFHGLMDTLIMSCYFFELGKEPSTSWDASYLISAYGKLLAAPLVIFTALVTVLPVVNAIAFTAAAVLAIIFLIMAYIKWWKPCPENFELAQNLTTMAREGRLEPVIGREDEVEQLIQCLASSSSSSRTHPFLLGDSGVGKTEIVKGLAMRIAQGTVPECLKNKKVIMFNTAKLADPDRHDTVDRVQRLMTRLGKNRKDVIVFFDEIHNAFIDSRATRKVGEALKTILDTNPDGLPYAIAATTKDDFNTYITDHAFKRRFQIIPVNQTPMQKTLWILREIVHREAFDLNVSPESLQKIWDESQKPKAPKNAPAQPAAVAQQPLAMTQLVTSIAQLATTVAQQAAGAQVAMAPLAASISQLAASIAQPPAAAPAPAQTAAPVAQPAMSVRILSKAISNARLEQTGYHPGNDLQKKKTEYSEKMSAYRMDFNPALLQELVTLEKDIQQLELERDNEMKELKSLTDLQKNWANQKKLMLQNAFRVSNSYVKYKEADSDAMKKFIVFANQFMLPKLEIKISEMQKRLKHKSVDQLISEELATL